MLPSNRLSMMVASFLASGRGVCACTCSPPAELPAAFAPSTTHLTSPSTACRLNKWLSDPSSGTLVPSAAFSRPGSAWPAASQDNTQVGAYLAQFTFCNLGAGAYTLLSQQVADRKLTAAPQSGNTNAIVASAGSNPSQPSSATGRQKQML